MEAMRSAERKLLSSEDVAALDEEAAAEEGAASSVWPYACLKILMRTCKDVIF